jgi:hypothetical protein
MEKRIMIGSMSVSVVKREGERVMVLSMLKWESTGTIPTELKVRVVWFEVAFEIENGVEIEIEVEVEVEIEVERVLHTVIVVVMFVAAIEIVVR